MSFLHNIYFKVHTAEVRNDAEAEAILRLKPDRIGHGTFISPSLIESPHLLSLLMESNIPVGMQLMCAKTGKIEREKKLKNFIRLIYCV